MRQGSSRSSIARGVAVSTGAQFGAKGIHFALNVISSLALIRYMSPEGYGELILVFTVTSLLGLVSDFGLTKLAVREATRDSRAEGEIIGTTVVARLALSVIAAVAVQLVLVPIGVSSEIRLAAAVLSLLFFVEALMTVVVSFHIRLEQQYEALVRVAGEALETVLILWLIARGAGLVPIVFAPVVGGLLAVGLALMLARRHTGVRPRFSAGRLRPLLRESLPIGPAVIIGVVDLKLGSLVLVLLRPTREIGLYGAAFQPIEYLLLASAVVINVLFPVLVRLERSDRPRLATTYQRGREALLAAFLPVPLLVAIVGREGVAAVFGPDFVEATLPLIILSWALLFLVLSIWNGYLLLALDKQKITFRYQAVALVAGVVAHGTLVPLFGHVGAALGMLVTAVVVVAWSTAAVTRFAALSSGGVRLGRVALAGGLLAGSALLLEAISLSWWMVGLVALVMYPLWLAMLRVVPIRKSWVRGKRPLAESVSL